MKSAITEISGNLLSVEHEKEKPLPWPVFSQDAARLYYSLSKSRKEEIESLLDFIRRAEGQIARGKPDDARQTLADAVGHYLNCDWWGGKECDCGGMR